MEPALELYLLSLGPPSHPLLPRKATSSATTLTPTSIPALVMAYSIELTARYTIPLIPQLPIVEYLISLNEFLQVRPRNLE